MLPVYGCVFSAPCGFRYSKQDWQNYNVERAEGTTTTASRTPPMMGHRKWNRKVPIYNYGMCTVVGTSDGSSDTRLRAWNGFLSDLLEWCLLLTNRTAVYISCDACVYLGQVWSLRFVGITCARLYSSIVYVIVNKTDETKIERTLDFNSYTRWPKSNNLVGERYNFLKWRPISI